MGLERRHNIRKHIAGALPKALASSWEARMRNRSIEKESWISLNDMISYHIEGDEIGLHVHELLTKSPAQMNSLVRIGLAELSKRVSNDPQLAHVQRITGWSELVYSHPRLFEMLGFTITERDETNRQALATMAREDFIQRNTERK